MEETPSSYMFADLRTFGGLTNTKAAKDLLTAETSYGGAAPRDHISEGAFFSHQIARSVPSQMHPEFFVDFVQSAQAITGKVVSNLAISSTHEDTAAHYSG